MTARIESVRCKRGVELLQGETFTLFASATRTTAVANSAGTAVYIGGERRRYIAILNVTAAANVAGDTLDVFTDWSLDGVTYFNGAHFTQVLGNGGAVAFFVVFDPSNPGTAGIALTTDAAVNTVRPSLFGPYVRGRYTLVNGGAGGQSFSFSLVGYAL